MQLLAGNFPISDLEMTTEASGDVDSRREETSLDGNHANLEGAASADVTAPKSAVSRCIAPREGVKKRRMKATLPERW